MIATIRNYKIFNCLVSIFEKEYKNPRALMLARPQLEKY